MSIKTEKQGRRERQQHILIVGGLSRLASRYRDCHQEVQVRVANTNGTRLQHSIEGADAVLVVVPHVSHAAVGCVRRHARHYGVPVAHAASPGIGEISRLVGELAMARTARR